jgi:hypothetical protein
VEQLTDLKISKILVEEFYPRRPTWSVEETLRKKIEWANSELIASQNVKLNIELCELIKSATEALISIERLGNKTQS